MNPDFWGGKRVFLTGHTGFKGSWLSLWLQRMGARVQGYSLPPPTDPSLYVAAGVERVVTSVIGDIRDSARIAREMHAFAPDVVLHLAAQSVVLSSYEDPIETYSTNVVGTASVLSAARDLTGRCAIVNVTTDKVYENRRWAWGYRENDDLGGRDPYSNSKACAELVARAFRESFFAGTRREIGLASARAGNVIGGGDWTPHQLIPEAVAAFSSGKPVVLRNPAAIRPWQHVLDCLSGYLTLAEALHAQPERYAEEWNFGPTDADMQPVAHVVEVLARPWGMLPAWVQDERVHPHEEMDLRLNSQKANRELRWAGRLALDEALAWTADWFRRHRSAPNARALCEEQIDHYMQLPSHAH
jgi:CDP-glucose 4,6-dehydratase